MTLAHHIPGRLLSALLLGLSGCATIPELAQNQANSDVIVELTDTPFYPQEKYQCGPAALATALTASGVAVHPEELVSKIYLPGRKGSLQIELLAATRASGRIPYILDPSLPTLIDELQAGNPIIVLQNLGVSWIPRWHYAVVVGFDGPAGTVVLRSGTVKRRLTPVNVFLRTWARSDFWAMAVLPPGQMPASVDRPRYLAAVADMEEVGRLSEAATAWQAALNRWPDDAVAKFGLGNTLLGLNQPEKAEAVFRALLANRPDLIVARNNLAIALMKQDRKQEAMMEIDKALEQADTVALIEELLDSKKLIQHSD